MRTVRNRKIIEKVNRTGNKKSEDDSALALTQYNAEQIMENKYHGVAGLVPSYIKGIVCLQAACNNINFINLYPFCLNLEDEIAFHSLALQSFIA